jgi:subtilase family serine protease
VSVASASGTQFSKVPNQRLLEALQHSNKVGHAGSSSALHISVSFFPTSASALQAYADAVSDPTSPKYRHFLTPAQIGQKFGQPSSKIAETLTYLKSQGFTIKLVDADNLHILADGTVSQVESAFKTTINRFHSTKEGERENADFVAYTSVPQLPSDLAPLVQHVGGIDTYFKPHPRSTLTPAQTSTLYGTTPEFNGGFYGLGRTVGVTNYVGFRLSNVPLFYKAYSLPKPSGGYGSNITVETLNGGAGSGTEDGEGDLDIEMVLGQAPLCHLIDYDNGSGDPIGTATLEQSDNKCDAITESYGWGFGTTDSTEVETLHTIHVEMSAEGITYMNATGDNGTSDLADGYTYPDSDPECLQVGGSAASVSSSGVRQSEVAWGDGIQGDGGGTGGWTTAAFTFNKLPSWQKGPNVPTNLNYRLVPDVALHAAGDANSYTGAYWFYLDGAATNGYLGTSFASPVFAGSLATAEEKIISLGGLPADSNGHQRFGRIQDVFYGQKMRSDVWYDITSGSNGYLPNGSKSSAGTGWDFCTGLGAINFNAFVSSVSTPPVIVDPNSASIYVDSTLGKLGSSSSGTYANLYSDDGLFYTVYSTNETAGQTAAAQIGYTLTTAPANLSQIVLNLAMEAPLGTTVFIYEYVYSGGTYTLYGTPIATQAMNGTDVAFSVTLSSPTTVAEGTKFMFVARALYPAHLGNLPFQFKIDEATATENF